MASTWAALPGVVPVTLRRRAKYTKKGGNFRFNAVTWMSTIVKAKESINPAGVTSFRIRRVVGQAYHHDKFAVERRKPPTEVVLRIVDGLVNHLVPAFHHWVVFSQLRGITCPRLPAKIPRLRLAQQVGKQQAQGIDLLPILPIGDRPISTQLRQPLLHGLRCAGKRVSG